MRSNAASPWEPTKCGSCVVSHPDGLARRPSLGHSVPNPSTCPISCWMTRPNDPAASRVTTSAESNCITPTIGRLPSLRTKHGPACPKIFPGPSIESMMAKITMSSTVSNRPGDPVPQLFEAIVTCWSGASPKITDSHFAAASVNADFSASLIAVMTRTSMWYAGRSPVAVKVTGLPTIGPGPATVAVRALAPGATVQDPTVAMPSTPVTGLAPLMIPPPTDTANVTCCPTSGVPAMSCTSTDGATFSGAPARPCCASPAFTTTEGADPATIALAVKTTGLPGIAVVAVADKLFDPVEPPSVQNTAARPVISLVSAALDTCPPPPVTANVATIPEIGWEFESVTWTVTGVGRVPDTVSICRSPANLRKCDGTCATVTLTLSTSVACGSAIVPRIFVDPTATAVTRPPASTPATAESLLDQRIVAPRTGSPRSSTTVAAMACVDPSAPKLTAWGLSVIALGVATSGPGQAEHTRSTASAPTRFTVVARGPRRPGRPGRAGRWARGRCHRAGRSPSRVPASVPGSPPADSLRCSRPTRHN